MQRLGEIGARLALTPLRVLAVLAEPARADIGRQVRRSLGFGKGPPPQIDTDPATAFLPPEAVARIVHGDLPSMVIGGLSALLLQTLHPLAMAGVAGRPRPP